MELLYGLIAICLFVGLAQPANFLLRKHRLRKLAEEFRVNFQEGDLSFWNLFFGLYYIFRWEERNANHLEGSIGDHKVHIYDKFSFPLGSELGARMTVVEIDVEAKKRDFTATDEVVISPFLKSVSKIRKILEGLKAE